MGGPMATSIAKAGLQPLVHDARPEAVRRLQSHGAQAAGSLAAMIERCDIIGICVPYDHQVRDMFLGPSGSSPSACGARSR